MKARGKGKNKADYTLQDSYEEFCSRMVSSTTLNGDKITIKSAYKITKILYTAIIKEYLKAKTNDIIYNAGTFKYPNRLGSLRIKKKKSKLRLKDGKLDTKYIPVDYKATNELWKKDPEAKKNKKCVFLTNDHTDGYKYSFFWSKQVCDVPNNSVYQFIPTRTLKRSLSEVLKRGDERIDFFL